MKKQKNLLKEIFSKKDFFILFLVSVLFYIAGYFSLNEFEILIPLSLILFLLFLIGNLEVYDDLFKYLRSCKNFIYFTIFVFLTATLIGFFFPVFFVEEIKQRLLEIVKLTYGMDSWQITNYIFQNNVLASFFSIFFGAFFGIFPLIFSITNGYLIGFVSSISTNQEGFFILWKLVPHGIFEIPAIILSIALGFRFGFYWDLFSEKYPIKILKNRVFNIIKIFIFVVIPLLIIAAILEGLLIHFFN